MPPRCEPGAHVLVLGATGVTGSMAVQLAKSVFGARHVSWAGRNTDATAVVTHRRRRRRHRTRRGRPRRARVAAAHAERPFDAVLDYLWGDPPRRCSRRWAPASSAAKLPRHTVRADRGDGRPDNERARGHPAQRTAITLSGMGWAACHPRC